MNSPHHYTLTHAEEYQLSYTSLVRDAAARVRDYLGNFQPEFGLTLGSGLGILAEELGDESIKIPYEEIPHFPKLNAEGHKGVLHAGVLEGVPILALQGRKHFFEVAGEPYNNDILQVVFAVHMLGDLGVPNYFVTNAAGGLDPDWRVGDGMIIESSNTNIPDPWQGALQQFQRVDTGELTVRHNPMNDQYDEELKLLLRTSWAGDQRDLHEGPYFAMRGPSFESPVQSRELQQHGYGAVGMSTDPEVRAARGRGIRCVGLSCITNIIGADGDNPASDEDVKEVLDNPRTREIFSQTLRNFFSAHSAAQRDSAKQALTRDGSR